MYSGGPPFERAKADESKYYQLIDENKWNTFWQNHDAAKGHNFFDEDFKDLITNMLQPLPHQRLCMADLIGHPWMQGTVATSEQVRAEFMKRQETVKARALED